MASRYWVGGTTTWDATAGSKWALTSGGAGGQAVPTSSDDVFLDSASGAVTVTINGVYANVKSLNCTGFTGTLAGAYGVNSNGSITLGSGMTFTNSGDFSFFGNATITSNGKSFGSLGANVFLNAPGGTIVLGDDFTSNGTILFSDGIFNASNKNVTCTIFSSTYSTARTITMGSGTWTLTGGGTVWDIAGANLTLNSNTSTIKIIGSFDALFKGNGSTYYNIWNSLDFGSVLTIDGANTFNDIKFDLDSTTFFTASQTQTVVSLTSLGTLGHEAILTETTGTSTWTISKSSGTVTLNYAKLSRSTATGGATFNATHSVDQGNNSGWNFIAENSGGSFLFNMI